MSATNWHNNLSLESVNRRAGGRRRINAQRKAQAQKRRDEIKKMIGGNVILLGSTFTRGMETRLANHFGVNRSTICRDVAALRSEFRAEHLCPTCRTLYGIPLKTLAKLAKKGLWNGCSTLGCGRK